MAKHQYVYADAETLETANAVEHFTGATAAFKFFAAVKAAGLKPRGWIMDKRNNQSVSHGVTSLVSFEALGIIGPNEVYCVYWEWEGCDSARASEAIIDLAAICRGEL